MTSDYFEFLTKFLLTQRILAYAENFFHFSLNKRSFLCLEMLKSIIFLFSCKKMPTTNYWIDTRRPIFLLTLKSIVFHAFIEFLWHSLKESLNCPFQYYRKCATMKRYTRMSFFISLNRKSFDLCHNNFFLWWNSFYRYKNYTMYLLLFHLSLYSSSRDPFPIFFVCKNQPKKYRSILW